MELNCFDNLITKHTTKIQHWTHDLPTDHVRIHIVTYGLCQDFKKMKYDFLFLLYDTSVLM